MKSRIRISEGASKRACILPDEGAFGSAKYNDFFRNQSKIH